MLTFLGVSLFFAVRGIVSDLRQVVDLTEIKHVEKDDKIISEGTEEGTYIFRLIQILATNSRSALRLDTLLKLSKSTSYDLRSSYAELYHSRYHYHC